MPERMSPVLDMDFEFAEIIRKIYPDQAFIQDDGSVGFRESATIDGYMLGNPEYPVAKYRELINTCVSQNLLTVITARTGTGKSTNVPLFLLESGLYDRVVVTQPRVIAARNLQDHVSDNLTEDLKDPEHHLVGFRTAVEGNSTDENAIIYVTDGLQLMHEIAKNGINKNQVLIIDEYHERSSNMDALLAIAIKNGIRTVVMSATLDAESISEHYSEMTGSQVPVIEILGSNYEVEERESEDLYRTVVEMAKLEKDIIVFLPGRKEIDSAMGRLKGRVPSTYTMLALHGDQTPDEQQLAMNKYLGGKIIFSTSVGQTSITYEGITCVIDCGYERTMVLDEFGAEMLATQPSSRATSEQRKGRVGRMQDGDIYFRSQLPTMPQLPAVCDQLAYDVPEVQRMRLDDLQLKLTAFGNSIDSLPFFQQPSEIEVSRGQERLFRLGMLQKLGKTALDGYAISPQGERAARLPLDVHSARMVLESRKFGAKLELQMMAAAAVQQLNGITSTAKGMENWRHLTSETRSDVIASIDFMVNAMKRTEAEQAQSHIVNIRYNKALRAFNNLASKRNLDTSDLTMPDEQERELLLRCIVAGTDELFVSSGKSYKDHHGKKRQPVKSTSVTGGSEFVVGSPFSLQQVRNKKLVSHALIASATNVTFDLLCEVIPDRITTTVDRYYLDDKGTPHTEEIVSFDGYPTRHRVAGVAKPGPKLQKFIIDKIFSTEAFDHDLPPNIAKVRSAIGEFKKLQHRTDEKLGINYSIRQIIASTIRQTDYSAISLEAIDPFIDQQSVDDIVPEDIRQEILRGSPDMLTIVSGGQALDLPVVYYMNRAHVTIAEKYYHLLPFVVGNDHRVSVRPHAKAPYLGLENARDMYELSIARPSRNERRAGIANVPKLFPTAVSPSPENTRNTHQSNSRIQQNRRSNVSRLK